MKARVKDANTIITDRSPQVPHVVTFDDGSEVEVNAADPMEAIFIAKAGSEKYLGKYCAGNHETCCCGGGWFNGVHITHKMFRKSA